MKNYAAYMTALNQIEIQEEPMPKPKAGEVLIQLEYVGICGSDVHYLQHGRIGDFVVEGEFILGHECSGTVVSVGADVTTHQAGDRVTLEPGATCGQCEYCTSGRYNLCPEVEFLATPPYHGCLKKYMTFPAHLAFHLPESISTKDGALVEPLSVGLEAASVGGVTLGSSVVILGAGCIGLTALLASKAKGASDIIVVDVISERLNKALELGATQVVNAAKEDATEKIMRATEHKGADIVMETAGTVRTTQQTIDVVKRGGVIVMVGMGADDIIPFNFAKLMSKVVDIRPIFRYKNQYPVALHAMEAKQIDVSKIVTHEYKFEDIAEAFRVNIEEKNKVIKVVVQV